MTSLLDKAALRAELRRRRAQLAKALPDAPHRVAALAPLQQIVPGLVVSAYQPLGSELDPWPLASRLKAAGARLALPVAARRDAPLVFRMFDAGLALEPDAFGIPAPPSSAPEVSPDLVIAPLLGFDRRGNRLGQGAGHYDRTLANLRAAKAVFVMGLAYAGQEVDQIPSEPHDQRLDAVLTDTGYIEVG